MLNKYEFYRNNYIRINDPPPESCFDKLKRKLLTDEPSPYHYDYILLEPSQNSVDNLILSMKQMHGYGSRKSGVSMRKDISLSSRSSARNPSLKATSIRRTKITPAP